MSTESFDLPHLLCFALVLFCGMVGRHVVADLSVQGDQIQGFTSLIFVAPPSAFATLIFHFRLHAVGRLFSPHRRGGAAADPVVPVPVQGERPQQAHPRHLYSGIVRVYPALLRFGTLWTLQYFWRSLRCLFFLTVFLQAIVQHFC